MESIEGFIDKKLIPFTFILSKNPVLLHDLLDANRQSKDRLTPSGSALGYKVNNKNMLVSFFVIAHIFFILPALGILHDSFANMDCHLSIVSAVVFTGLMFVSFSAFKEYLVERVSTNRIKEAWVLHFPLFSYEEHSQKVADLYNEAIKKKVPRGELEYFVMKGLSR